MRSVISNSELCVTVESFGAEIVSVVCRESGNECIWQADPAVWARHAPILFPYTGKLPEGKLTVNGRDYKGGQHGFARDMEHTLVFQSPTKLVYELASCEETLSRFPFAFRLISTIELCGKRVLHTLTVENPGEELLRFGIGYHPAFRIPFDASHSTEDYSFRFDREESPLCIDARPNGLVSGKCYYLAANTREIPITDSLFDNDSFCMANLQSASLGLYENGSHRHITCTIRDFPYTLIWGKRGTDGTLPFVCIEPWQSLPGIDGGSTLWENRAAAAVLAPGESFSCTLETEFDR